MITGPVLIVGHGYLGSQIVRLLRDSSVDVSSAHRGEPDPSQSIFSADVASLESLRELAADITPSAILHCASSSRGGAATYRSVFVDGIANLRETFPGTPVWFTSSTSVYGQTDGSTVDESSPTIPDRETSRLLLEAESLARDSGGAALRLAGIYGPGRSVHLQKLFSETARIETGAVSRFLNQIHRDDAARAFLHLLRQEPGATEGKIFNVVDDTPLTQRECYERLAACFDLPEPATAPPDPDRKRGWTHKIVSNAALRSTGWSPLYPSFLDAVAGDPELVPSIRALL